VIAYLDTNIVVWLAQGALSRITPRAQQLLETASLLISPIVLVELEYLYEVHRIKLPSQDIYVKLQHEIGMRVCDLDFPAIANMTIAEKWTRDPFDRLIVAHAKANGLAPLISADQEIQQHYPRTIW
jgi:PIN domain nuclease of toxin-antitoxin system